MSFTRWIRFTFSLLMMVALLGGSSIPPGDKIERVRSFTRNIEFDYVSWTLGALGIKLSQAALKTSDYLPSSERRKIVLEYSQLVHQIQQDEAQLNDIYADPKISDPAQESASLREELNGLYSQRAELGPLAESIVQSQIAYTVAGMGLSLGGQTVPPVLYHMTPLPLALIISPRDVIRQEADISLLPDLPVDQQAALEDDVDKSANVSSLVVNVGGIGLYPTMVMQTSDINWLAEVVSHEWVHNFLTLRPLGMNYLTSPELRTMNETTASIAGKEIGRALIQHFYPELLPPPPPETPTPAPSQPAEPPAFDFNHEMHITRLQVDQLLAENKVDEAEAYMEARRQVFWDHGYHIRKLNQAYFAFYGAYADQPGGAAGKDIVGSAVRSLRANSSSLADFLNQISWMSTFDQLQRAVGEKP
jgi:hypothetical protein